MTKKTKKTNKRVGRRAGKKPGAAKQAARVIRVFAKQKLSRELAKRVAAPPPSGFDRAVTLEGGTQHFQAYFATGFANGPAIAQGVLATCEKDYNLIVNFFSGLVPPTFPMNIVVAPGIGGAYHYGCAAVDLYCDGDASASPDIDHTRYLVIAEEVEVFEAAQNKGWNCGASNGEGLSRVLATELYPAELDGFFTAASWLDSNRPDWVSQTDPTDQNAVSTGCAVLFLNYLRHQLNYTWPQIVQAAGSTLDQTYTALAGAPGGFAPFKTLLDSHFPPGQPSGLTTDNPFPL
ncbi:MAG: hypothetical protein ACYDD2_14565 [Candidatus Acidiferrales bacterium]